MSRSRGEWKKKKCFLLTKKNKRKRQKFLYVRKSLGLPFQASMDNFEWDFIQLLFAIYLHLSYNNEFLYLRYSVRSLVCTLGSILFLDMYTEGIYEKKVEWVS